MKASTLAKKTVQEDWKERERAAEMGWEHSPGEQRSGMEVAGCAVWVSWVAHCSLCTLLCGSKCLLLCTLYSGTFPSHVPDEGRASSPPCPPLLTPAMCWEAPTRPSATAWI